MENLEDFGIEKQEILDNILNLENEMINTFSLMEKKLVDLKIQVEKYSAKLKEKFYGGNKDENKND